jgi:hypothetical protein
MNRASTGQGDAPARLGSPVGIAQALDREPLPGDLWRILRFEMRHRRPEHRGGNTGPAVLALYLQRAYDALKPHYATNSKRAA